MIIPMNKNLRILLFVTFTGVMLASTQMEGPWFAGAFVAWILSGIWAVGE